MLCTETLKALFGLKQMPKSSIILCQSKDCGFKELSTGSNTLTEILKEIKL